MGPLSSLHIVKLMLIPELTQLTLLRRIVNLPVLAMESPFKGHSNLSQSGRLAQLVERQPYKLNVVGSIPAAPTIFSRLALWPRGFRPSPLIGASPGNKSITHNILTSSPVVFPAWRFGPGAFRPSPLNGASPGNKAITHNILTSSPVVFLAWRFGPGAFAPRP